MNCESCDKPMERLTVIHQVFRGDGTTLLSKNEFPGYQCRTSGCWRAGRVVYDRPALPQVDDLASR